MNILFIGNSFTQGSGDETVSEPGGVPFLFAELALAAGQERPQTQLCALGGRRFSDHMDDETGALTAIREGGWDHVVLQGYSTAPTHAGHPESFFANGQLLHQEILRASPNATTVLYQTWARHPIHPMVSGPEAAFPGGPAQMQQELREGYAQLQAQLGERAVIARVGDAWELALDESDIRLHADDDYHANRNGSYLAALVILGTVFQTPLPQFSALAEVIDGDAAFLQDVAGRILDRS
jgi:hypothetical protein